MYKYHKTGQLCGSIKVVVLSLKLKTHKPLSATPLAAVRMIKTTKIQERINRRGRRSPAPRKDSGAKVDSSTLILCSVYEMESSNALTEMSFRTSGNSADSELIGAVSARSKKVWPITRNLALDLSFLSPSPSQSTKCGVRRRKWFYFGIPPLHA